MSRRLVRPLVFASALALVVSLAIGAVSPATTTQPEPEPAKRAITPGRAAVLGVVEGVTEYLPVSSTGHLILAGHWLGLTDTREKDAVDAFEVVIQIGAVLAVVGLYRRRVGQMLRGLAGRDPAGRRLFVLLLVAFLPAAMIGLIAHKWIKAHLFAPAPVVAALAIGGVLMIAVEAWRRRTPGQHTATIESMTIRMALLIGFAQCLALWPGTSRSMVTILAALLVGLEIRAAAEFSFLLALPTLGAASAYDAAKHHADLARAAGPLGMAIGLAVSGIVAAIAVRSFVAYLGRRGLTPFGWYRIALAAVLGALLATGRMSMS